MIKCYIHCFLTSQIADAQNKKEINPPNNTMIIEGLSRVDEGSIKGITVEPNKSCPKPSERSDSLSSCLLERWIVMRLGL